MPPILSVRDLRVEFELSGGGLMSPPAVLTAVDGVSFDLEAGETLAVVGESGCGKSTLGRAILQLVPAQSGRVIWLGQDLCQLNERALRPIRRDLQIVFQDPLAALDPRQTIGASVAEPLQTHQADLTRAELNARVAQALTEVGLDPTLANRYPHEFSGGQCQRVVIARAMITRPKLIVCDEAVSALDVSIQAQIVNLLGELQRRYGLALIFISHNLAVVRHLSRRVLVLYLGRTVELAPTATIFAEPRHFYTRALLNAVPPVDPRAARARPAETLVGDPPSPLNPPSGCGFRTRCPHADAQCALERPPLVDDSGHAVSCYHWSAVGSA